MMCPNADRIHQIQKVRRRKAVAAHFTCKVSRYLRLPARGRYIPTQLYYIVILDW